MHLMLTAVIGLVVLAGVILSCFGAPRTRLFGIAGGVVWCLGTALTIPLPGQSLTGTLPVLLVLASNALDTIGIGLLALAAVLPGGAVPFGPGGYPPPAQPGAGHGHPGGPPGQPPFPGQPPRW